MGKADDYDPNDENARRTRVWTGSMPFAYWTLGIVFAALHHWMNSALDGKPIDAVAIASFNVPYLDRRINLSQKEQLWVLSLFAFLWKSCIVRSMACGLLQHAWRSLRTSSLSVRQIDCVIALQHRKPTGFLSFTVLTRCFPTVVLSALSIVVPYSAILPVGSLTVDTQTNSVGIYRYNARWLVGPIGLIVAFITILWGTHSLWKHNTSNLSFSFSHIVAATRTELFDDALRSAKRHHIPHKLMEQCGELCFGDIGNGKEGFAGENDLLKESDDGEDGSGCFSLC
ncbi:hypothetical protein R3P38DRAFT_2876570 [Favolaschia claudopus]|uniref:Uncharacterized protein n=1 Tax=Favolaschia claudopus TaxID=2862362 RepID=A0AAW0D7E7_9AGAR